MLCFINASEIRATAPAALWESRIFLGEFCIVQGDPGSCKTTMLIDLAAKLSTGRALPGGSLPMEPRNVIWLQGDSTNAVLRHQLDIAHADCSRVSVLDFDAGVTGATSLEAAQQDLLQVIDGELTRTRAVMVAVDPLPNFFAVGDYRKTIQIGQRLKHLASKHECAVVGVIHMIKSARTAATGGYASGGLMSVARSVLLVGSSPIQRGLRVVASVKNSFGDKPKSLMFRMRCDQSIAWDGTCDVTADELLDQSRHGRQSAVDQAIEFLRTALRDGPRLVQEVGNEALAAGISERTLRRAREDLHLQTNRNDYGGPVRWALPAWLIRLDAPIPGDWETAASGATRRRRMIEPARAATQSASQPVCNRAGGESSRSCASEIAGPSHP